MGHSHVLGDVDGSKLRKAYDVFKVERPDISLHRLKHVDKLKVLAEKGREEILWRLYMLIWPAENRETFFF